MNKYPISGTDYFLVVENSGLLSLVNGSGVKIQHFPAELRNCSHSCPVNAPFAQRNPLAEAIREYRINYDVRKWARFYVVEDSSLIIGIEPNDHTARSYLLDDFFVFQGRSIYFLDGTLYAASTSALSLVSDDSCYVCFLNEKWTIIDKQDKRRIVFSDSIASLSGTASFVGPYIVLNANIHHQPSGGSYLLDKVGNVILEGAPGSTFSYTTKVGREYIEEYGDYNGHYHNVYSSTDVTLLFSFVSRNNLPKDLRDAFEKIPYRLISKDGLWGIINNEYD